MTTIKEKLSRGINPPHMLQSMASGYRRAALEEIERLEKVIDELKAKLAELENPLKYNPAPVYTSNCIRHPAAPHGVDVDASWRAGKTVCVCASWAPGDAS